VTSTTDGNGSLRATYATLIALFVFLSSAPALASPGEESRVPRVGARDVECLALTIYHESRGLDERGRMAVAHVVLNRVESSNRSVCDVVYEHRRGQAPQFSWIIRRDTRPHEREAWRDARSMASMMLSNRPRDFTYGATHFYNPRIVRQKPGWARNRPTTQIGAHIFVRVVENRSR